MEIFFVLLSIFIAGYVLGKTNFNKPPTKIKTTYKPHVPEIKINSKIVDIDGIELSKEQKTLYKEINDNNSNVYITGKAGTGKSVLLQYFVNNTEKQVAVVAPTGVAALNIAGQTIHSFFKLAPEVLDPKDVKIDYKTKEILRHVDTIVIDEISMVRVDLMETINTKLQLAKGNDLPFGGAQMVLFGDLFQLPPVVNDGELHRYFNDTYGGIYFFNAPVFQTTKLKIYELDTIFRQTDKEFKKLLNAVRNGSHNSGVLNELNKRSLISAPDVGIVTLAGTNSTVSRINHKRLQALASEEKTYIATITGDIQQSSFPTEKELCLKVGAQIMMLKNDREKPSRWVNGTLGIITKLSEENIKVNIDGVEHSVSKETWEKIRYYYDPTEHKLSKEVVSSFQQFPIRLAWAITIHKSQGQTYQSVSINLSDGAFAHGQTYVALSRCQNLEGLYLTQQLRNEDIILDQDIIEFMKKVEILKE